MAMWDNPNWNYWPGIFSVHGNFDQIANAMNKAVEQDKDEYTMSERDRVLGSLVVYLADHYVLGNKNDILRILETYCGKPVGTGTMEDNNPPHMKACEFKITKEDCEFWRDN